MQKRDNEINLGLDSYDDIFSDFDPRPYKKKALSVDFLSEAKRASRDLAEVKLKLFIPTDKRNLKEEGLIKKRLNEHFKKHHGLLEKEKRQIIKHGLLYAGVGIILMIFATFILLSELDNTFLITFLIVILEPAGWFLFWEGSYQTIFESKMKETDYMFYKKMTKCDISFVHYK